MKQTTANSAPPKNVFPPWWGLVAGLSSLLPLLLFAYFGNAGRGRAAAICVAVVVVAVRARWDLTKYAWFWWTLTILIVLHIPVIVLVPWTSKSYPGITLLPVAVVDYAIVYGCIKLAEKLMKSS